MFKIQIFQNLGLVKLENEWRMDLCIGKGCMLRNKE